MAGRNERRQIYIAEHHPHGATGDVWLRASCSMCSPRWRGPWRRALDLIGNGRAMDPAGIEAELRDRAKADALRHADLAHGGKVGT